MPRMKLNTLLVVGRRSYDAGSVVEMDEFAAKHAINWNTAVPTSEPLVDTTPRPETKQKNGPVETATSNRVAEKR